VSLRHARAHISIHSVQSLRPPAPRLASAIRRTSLSLARSSSACALLEPPRQRSAGGADDRGFPHFPRGCGRVTRGNCSSASAASRPNSTDSAP